MLFCLPNCLLQFCVWKYVLSWWRYFKNKYILGLDGLVYSSWDQKKKQASTVFIPCSSPISAHQKGMTYLEHH